MKKRRAVNHNPPVALTIAGSDSGGAAGVQADLLTFAALGVYGTTAITCLTAQNPTGVAAMHEAPANFVAQQLRQVADFYPVRALKTGMLFSAAIVREVAAFIDKHPRIGAVVDPVMAATSGAVLLQDDAIEAIRENLLPLATLVTPNLDEAGVLLGRKPETEREAVDAAQTLSAEHGVPFLVKGGHLRGDRVVDVLARPKRKPRVFHGNRVHGVDTHGGGCTLSAAVAAWLAHGHALEDAVARARAYLRRGFSRPLVIRRTRYIAHD